MTAAADRQRTAVITGSSSGIGRAIAVQLACDGYDVIVHAGRNESAAQNVSLEIQQLGREARPLVCDFSDPDNLGSFVAECWNWKNGIDTWINNAGIDVLTGERSKWNFQQKLAAIFQIDVTATLLLSRLIGQRMHRRYDVSGIRGSIINIGWDQAAHGMAGDSGEMFAASKGAIIAATKSLAQSLAPAVRVNCLAPGWIQTSWGENASAKWQDRAKRDSLLDRWGCPADVAAAASFLADPKSEFVNGQVLPINGGFRFSN